MAVYKSRGGAARRHSEATLDKRRTVTRADCEALDLPLELKSPITADEVLSRWRDLVHMREKSGDRFAVDDESIRTEAVRAILRQRFDLLFKWAGSPSAAAVSLAFHLLPGFQLEKKAGRPLRAPNTPNERSLFDETTELTKERDRDQRRAAAPGGKLRKGGHKDEEVRSRREELLLVIKGGKERLVAAGTKRPSDKRAIFNELEQLPEAERRRLLWRWRLSEATNSAAAAALAAKAREARRNRNKV